MSRLFAIPRRLLSRHWPWLLLAVALLPAPWHVLDFPDDPDAESPEVVRPTFSRRPPPAYRLAEPGDTIDHVALYGAAGAVVLAASGLIRACAGGSRAGLWPTALGLALGAFWHAATPGPTFDGWHGLGWRVVADPTAPAALRAAVGSAALGLIGIVVGSIAATRDRWGTLVADGRARGTLGLLAMEAVLVGLRQGEIAGSEPSGYWPRWAFAWGMLAFDLALIRSHPPLGAIRWPRRGAIGLAAAAAAWFGLASAGLWVTWYHRPLGRFREVVPGRIYISAMPSARGLEVAYRRHPFKTIINLFPEDTPFRSPRLPEELRFARTHGIRYVGSTSDPAQADAFLDRTLALAQDPAAWPILVHCHGCIDRTPAWVGIYRFVVEGRPLVEIMTWIEQHRGYRPKASVTLLYNRALARLAPLRYANDPTAQLLRRCAEGMTDDD